MWPYHSAVISSSQTRLALLAERVEHSHPDKATAIAHEARSAFSWRHLVRRPSALSMAIFVGVSIDENLADGQPFQKPKEPGRGWHYGIIWVRFNVRVVHETDRVVRSNSPNVTLMSHEHRAMCIRAK